MTNRYVNVKLGTAGADGSIPVASVTHGVAQANHVSVVYDDSVVVNQSQLAVGIRAALQTALGNAGLTR